jgi:hypothetical protein
LEHAVSAAIEKAAVIFFLTASWRPLVVFWLLMESALTQCAAAEASKLSRHQRKVEKNH